MKLVLWGFGSLLVTIPIGLLIPMPDLAQIVLGACGVYVSWFVAVKVDDLIG